MSEPVANAVTRLCAHMLHFAAEVDRLRTSAEVLEGLHNVAFDTLGIGVLGAALMPIRWGDWDRLEKGKTVFLHRSAPQGWWDEWNEHNRTHTGPILALARLSLAPFTTTDVMTKLEPLGIDRYSIELGLKYGIRDTLVCPVGGRWVVIYWSRKPMISNEADKIRAILFMGAAFAAVRLQRLIDPQLKRLPAPAVLTPRELAVLRLMSEGYGVAVCAEMMGLSAETVRTHVKKAQIKLGVRNRTHAVVQALRIHLIP